MEHPPVAAQPAAWAVMVRIEPRLRRLLREIKRIRDDRQSEYFCRNAVWYGWHPFNNDGFKGEMHALVGFRAARPELRSSACYDIAYQALYHALPPCRGPCGCPTY